MSEPQVTFVQNLLPALGSGDYSVTVTQTVEVNKTKTDTFTVPQAMFVAGARYSLVPEAVSSVFPPEGHQGEFSNALPHVVLAQPTLPWQRSIDAPQTSGSESRSVVPSAGQPSWLALLLFDENDPSPEPVARTVADLAGGNGVLSPKRSPERGEEPVDPVTTIDVPLETFNAIAPSAEDLSWLAHGRRTLQEGGGTETEAAVVIGNRLPRPGSINTVHLVSLEGRGPYLPSNEGKAATTFPAGTTAVRLVSLRSWKFTAIDLGETFEGLLMNPRLAPGGLQMPFTQPSSGEPAAEEAVRNAFGMGYTALDHALQNGGSTVSWYRGPLLPLGSAADADPPYENADEQVRFDPETGMLDVSRAVAWQLGRLLAVRDLAFSTALYRWKLGQTRAAVSQLEQELIEVELPPPARGAARAPGARLARVAKTVLVPAMERLLAPEER